MMGHIFNEKKTGHVPDTPENRKFLRELVKDMKNYIKEIKERRAHWFSRIDGKGKQWWAWIRDGKIRDGGLNNTPLPWNDDTGFCRAIIPRR